MTQSLYEIMNGGFTTVMKQHFVDWFSGKGMNSDHWQTLNISGDAASYAMSDYGLQITSPTGAASNANYFNNKRQYDSSGSVLIVVSSQQFDLVNKFSLGSDGSVNDQPEHMEIQNSYSGWSSGTDDIVPTDMILQVQDAPSYVGLKLGIQSRLEPTTFKLEGKASSAEASVNGKLAGTVTSTVIASNTKLEPRLFSRHTYTPPSVARKSWFRYCEVYNT